MSKLHKALLALTLGASLGLTSVSANAQFGLFGWGGGCGGGCGSCYRPTCTPTCYVPRPTCIRCGCYYKRHTYYVKQYCYTKHKVCWRTRY